LDRLKEEKKQISVWSWYDACMILAGGDVLKLEDVSKLNLYTALTFLTRKYIQYKEEERKQRSNN